MAKEIKIPQIAEGVEVATVNEVLVAKGDSVEKDQALIAVESDKASVEIPSPESGTVASIKVSSGDEVKIGDVFITLEASEEEGENKTEKTDTEDSAASAEKEKDSQVEKEEDGKDKKESKKDNKSEKSAEDSEDDTIEEDRNQQENSEKQKETSQKEDTGNKNEEKDKESEITDEEEKAKKSSAQVPAAPSVRRLARELGVDLNDVKESGDNGRISQEDVKSFAKEGKTSSTSTSQQSTSLPDFSKWGATETQSLSGIRKATAKSMSAAWTQIPHVFQFEEAEITAISEYMRKIEEKAEKTGNKVTITAILVKIAAYALRQFPKFNASLDMENEQLILKNYVHIGVAVDTEKGLLVPVLRNVDQKSILQIAREITQLAEKAREQKLSTEEMEGGCFTISNLGGIGGTSFTPIINAPQVAILGVSRSTMKPVYEMGQFEPREMLPLSLSYDHRVIDGAEGIRFLNWIAQALEDPYKALLGA